MKVIVVTSYTPTPENTRGISGLIYAILRHRPSNVLLKVFSFNTNSINEKTIQKIEKELNAEIVLLKKPWWYKLFDNVWLWRFNKFFMKSHINCYLVNEKLVNRVRSENSDLVWIYPYFFYKLAVRMPEQKFVISGCDCEALIRVRNFDTRDCLMDPKALRHNVIMLKKGLHFERNWNLPNLKVHFVGMEDCRFYEQIYGYQNSYFLLHPHYLLKDKMIDFSHDKLKVIIAGSYNIYMKDDIDRMLPNLLKYREELQKNYEFTILGKGWDNVETQFKENGFPCVFKTWVEDYAGELVKYDIQLSPISYGTGTKGKVLSAMANGLLVVGSKYAFENICVRHGDSCVRYQNAREVASLLLAIASKRNKYQEVAEKGRSQVRIYHSPSRISKRFFDIYGTYFNI